MAEESQTQTQTQNSQIDWSQPPIPSIPTSWGRLYLTLSLSKDKNCWREKDDATPGLPMYYDLTGPEFTLGRALNCDLVMKKDLIKEEIIKNISKQHFSLKRDFQERFSPSLLTDLSYNGTFVNGEKVGKGKSRVLEDNDEISVTHPQIKIFVFKDLMVNEQDQVPKEISKKYYISRVLGQGACGVVRLVFNKLTCTKYAMKTIKKSRLTNGPLNNLNDPKKIMNEVNILKSLKHPCVISTEEVFDTPDAVYIVLELMAGGELFERISKQKRLSERLTKVLFRQMVLAVKYLHSKGITHRDLKPENVLLEGPESETLVKITDFGLSKFVGEQSFMKTMCGTPFYLAPEILRANGQRTYGPEVDVWSLGVIFFICLSGYLPFSSDYSGLSLRDQILTGRFRFSEAHWARVSLPAKLLMRRMLTVRVDARITLDEILNDKWMIDKEVINTVDLLLSRAVSNQPGSVQLSRPTLAYSDEENKSLVPCADEVTLIVEKTKRMLSDDHNSCEPIPKKMRLGMHKVKLNSSETNSANSVESR